MEGISRAFYTKIVSISQRNLVIKLIEKKDRDKRYIKNWRTISLLNVATKIFPKAISNKLEAVLLNLISSQQTAYVKNRFVGGSGRVISEITEISDWFNIKGFLVTMNIEKTVDSLVHDILSSVLIKFRFGKNFYDMSRHFTKNQLLCVINGRATTHFLNLALVKLNQSPRTFSSDAIHFISSY